MCHDHIQPASTNNVVQTNFDYVYPCIDVTSFENDVKGDIRSKMFAQYCSLIQVGHRWVRVCIYIYIYIYIIYSRVSRSPRTPHHKDTPGLRDYRGHGHRDPETVGVYCAGCQGAPHGRGTSKQAGATAGAHVDSKQLQHILATISPCHTREDTGRIHTPADRKLSNGLRTNMPRAAEESMVY